MIDIQILILTDDKDKWVDYVLDNIQITRPLQVRRTRNEITIRNDLLYFEIRSSFRENCRGKCFSCAILDKPLSYRVEREILRPCVKASIRYTDNYEPLDLD